MILNKFIGNRAFYRRVLAVALPILLHNVITNFVSLIDNIMIGQVGTEQMSGVAIVNELIWVFNVCIFGGVNGAGIFTAQYFGKRDNKGVRDTFRAKLCIVLAMTAIGIFLFTAFQDGFISLFLHEGKEGLDIERTLIFAKQYMVVMMFQMLPFAIMQAYAGTLRETGETVVPMISGFAAVFVNVGLNYILIFGKLGAPELGIVGAAIATVIARFVECIIVVLWTHIKKDRNEFIRGAYRSFKIPASLMRAISKKGVPLMINEILWSVGAATLMQCYSVRGLEVVSALNISTTVSNLFRCAYIAMGSTISILIGQRLGAGETVKARDENTKLLTLGVMICSVVGGIMALLSAVIPEAYNTTDSVKALAAGFILVCAVLMPFSGFAYSSYFTLLCGGNTGIAFLFDGAFMWVLSIPVAFIFSRGTAVPVIALFVIVQSLDLVKAALGFVLVKKGIWVNNLVGKNVAQDI